MLKRTIRYNKKTNLLEDSIYKYELQDVKEPHLFRELFNYESIPKISFNNRHVPINMPKEIWITDTTFRDGQTDYRFVSADVPSRRTQRARQTVGVLSLFEKG